MLSIVLLVLLVAGAMAALASLLALLVVAAAMLAVMLAATLGVALPVSTAMLLPVLTAAALGFVAGLVLVLVGLLALASPAVRAFLAGLVLLARLARLLAPSIGTIVTGLRAAALALDAVAVLTGRMKNGFESIGDAGQAIGGLTVPTGVDVPKVSFWDYVGRPPNAPDLWVISGTPAFSGSTPLVPSVLTEIGTTAAASVTQGLSLRQQEAVLGRDALNGIADLIETAAAAP